MPLSCCARRRLVIVAVAFSFAALLAPAPSLFADQTMYFQVANYPASQDNGQYSLSGEFNWDLTTASPATPSIGSFTITPSGGTPSTFQINGIGGASIQAAGNVVDLVVPVGNAFGLGSTADGNNTATLSWDNGAFGISPYLEATTGGPFGTDNVLYDNAPSPLDAFGLPSNGPWIVATASYLPGDVNFDDIVNGLDIADVASHWLQTGNPGGIPGDANFDGVVNGLDISVIASHWLTTSAGGSAAAVPERSTITLAVLGAIALSRRVRDAKRHLFGNP